MNSLKTILNKIDGDIGNSEYCNKNKCYNCKLSKVCDQIRILKVEIGLEEVSDKIKEEYETSQEKRKRLKCYENCGCDNWNCYNDCAFWEDDYKYCSKLEKLKND